MVWGALGFGEPQQAAIDEVSEADYPECDYDENLSPLYEAIEERAWIAVNQFLHSGYWPESFFPDNMAPEDQARTWVTRYEMRPDGTKKVRWSQLPIHAAVIFGAPSVVIQQLVEAFPQSIRCTDDHRMLPLHLAFRHGSDDSVLALFLEEFPEAVNVRGYKGRLPVDCANKGPNPERGAIIQTILQKNQSAWERKKSAVQLKELYCVKEALKIKGQKVSHLETAIREIKSREHKTRKELGLTMTELKTAKVKAKGSQHVQSAETNTAEKKAIRQLVEKLAALEMATKDLVLKEKATKKNLEKTKAELEVAKKTRPTEDQAKQFARLDQVASCEDDVLTRTEEIDPKSDEAPPAPKAVAVPVVAAPKAAETIAAPKAVDPATVKKTPEEPKAVPKPAEAKSVASVKSTKSKGTILSRLSRKSKTSTKPKASSALPTVIKALAPIAAPVVAPSAPRSVAETTVEEKVLEKTITTLETEVETIDGKTFKAQEELEAASVCSGSSKKSKKQSKAMSTMQAEMASLKETSAKTNEQLSMAMHAMVELKTNQAKGADAVIQEKKMLKLQAEKNNKMLEDKVALLDVALTQFEAKSNMAKEEMNNIKSAIDGDSEVSLTPTQEKYIRALESAMKKLEENSDKTKEELTVAKAELTATKAKEEAAARAQVEAAEAAAKAAVEAAEKVADLAAQKAVAAATSAATMVAEKAITNAAAENKLGEEKLQTVEKANKDLETKIATLEATMAQFEEKAAKTKTDMDQAMNDLMASDASVATGVTGATGASELKLTKKQKKHMQALEDSMKKLEGRATRTKDQLDNALIELTEIKKKEASKMKSATKSENKALKDLSKKVQVLQSAMVGFEVKETKTMNELEKTMKELEEVSNKRFEVLSVTAEHTQSLSTDGQFNKEVTKLEKRASKEEKRMVELEAAVQDILSKSGSTKEELAETKKLLGDLESKNGERGEPVTKEEKEAARQDAKLTKDLTKKVATLQSAVIGFEVKETRTMKELEHTMKQLEELTSKRFEVLEKASALKEQETAKLSAAGVLAEEKVNALHSAMKELEQNSALTHSELEKTKLDLDSIKTAALSGDGVSKTIILNQEKQITNLSDKIGILQDAVTGFEAKETKTMQELEQTMKQLEELTAKRFEVLQKVAGREIEAVKTAEATKYSEKSIQEEKKVVALESAMRELESKAYQTKLELEKTMKSLEEMEVKHTSRSLEVAGVSKDEKHVMRELVSKVADIQEAVMNYDEKELKTTQQLEATKLELEATKKEVEELREQQSTAAAAKDIIIIATDDNKSVEAVDEEQNDDAKSVLTETTQRVTDETILSLETAIHQLTNKLATEHEKPAEAGKSLPDVETVFPKAASAAIETVPTPNQQVVEEVVEKAASAVEPEVIAEPEIIEEPQQTEVVEEVIEKVASAMEEPRIVEKVASTTGEEPKQTQAGPATTPVPAPVVAAPTPTPNFAVPTITAAPIAPPSSHPVMTAKPEKRRSFFSKLTKSSKKSTQQTTSKSCAPRKVWNVSFGGKKNTSASSLPAAPAAPAAPVARATAEQRKLVQATHGAEIASVLTDLQILDIVSKMDTSAPVTETTPALEPALSGLSKSGAESVAKSIKSVKSVAKSVKSTKSAKAEESSQAKSVKSSKSKGSVAPISLDEQEEPKDILETQDTDLLVTQGTYDDGFEINF